MVCGATGARAEKSLFLRPDRVGISRMLDMNFGEDPFHALG
jgi:hypothetical protein